MRHFKVTLWLGIAVALTTLPGCVRLSVGTSQPPPAPIVNVTPPSPIPANTPPAPPAIPNLPAASATTPPADRISDPVTSAAACGGWAQQSDYGDRWQSSSTWWEYQCTVADYQHFDPCVGQCPAFCGQCWSETRTGIDYFYWDGAHAVFYGQSYTDEWGTDDALVHGGTAHWWDAPTTQWYDLGPIT